MLPSLGGCPSDAAAAAACAAACSPFCASLALPTSGAAHAAILTELEESGLARQWGVTDATLLPPVV